MARLFYMSLDGVGDWHYAIRATGVQLRPYFNYLDRAIKAAQRNKPVLAWRQATPKEREIFEARRRERHEDEIARAKNARRERDRKPPSTLPTGTWIVLEPPPWNLEEPDATFEAFFTAREVYEDPRCDKDAGSARLDHDREGRALLLPDLPAAFVPRNAQDPDERPPPTAAAPWGPLLWLRPNTYTLERQLAATRALENTPPPRLSALIRLFTTRYRWQPLEPATIPEHEWVFLRPTHPGAPLRDGTQEQRDFVQVALGTPDFAILEGPPGSGKTTAICELIAHLARQGKRVLLVASTHVAVDNVLERVLKHHDDPTTAEKLFLPLRIGDEDNVTLDIIKPWTYQRLLRTWRAELRDFLAAPGQVDPTADPARAILRDALSRNSKVDDPLANLILEASNLVCGTTIGILQHPTIRNARKSDAAVQPFDVMILDEASKTTLTEFLVPALYARRWIIVGDVRQLSPYVEEQDLAENLRHLVPATHARAALLTALAPPEGKPRGRRSLRSLITTDPAEAELIAAEAEARGVLHVDLDRHAARSEEPLLPLLYADIVTGSQEAMLAYQHRLPVDLAHIDPRVPPLPLWDPCHDAWLNRQRQHRRRVEIPEDDELNWANEVAWRLIRSYELRQSPEDAQRYDQEIGDLLPTTLPARDDRDPRDRLESDLNTTRRVALPSILELLQRGFQRLEDQRQPVAITDGLPRDVLADRLISLSFQHRMHPDISAFPRERFYSPRAIEPDERDDDDNDNNTPGSLTDTPYLLRDAATMRAERQWRYPRYARRALWIDTAPRPNTRGNANPAEADRVVEELEHFATWARDNAPPRGDHWTVAILTFYRGQETLLRRRLQQLTRQFGNSRNFRLPRVHVTLCTVDRFQGHEADLVLLSFVKSGTVGFLNSPNRINVAITRARYQLVLIGHRTYFADEKRCRSRLLNALAASPYYGHDIAYAQPSKD
jgi:hypothetical protein